MKNCLWIIFFFSISFFTVANSQNVGVNEPNPEEALDVNGNINFSGELKVNNLGGEEGQFLQANGNGTMQWTNPSQYSNFRSFVVDGSWTVPANVDKIMIEMWGGGGGGALGGGGGAGGYLRAVRSVTPSTSIDIVVGTGGLNSVSGTASSGETSQVTAGSGIAFAYGGRGATTTSSGNTSQRPFASSSWVYIPSSGNGGSPTTIDYVERTAGVFIAIRKGGTGGDSYGHPNSGGKGANSALSLTGGTLYSRFFGTNGSIPGAGGGGGVEGAAAKNGGNGLVIIYWN